MEKDVFGIANPNEPVEKEPTQEEKPKNPMEPKSNTFISSADCDPSLGIKMIPRYNFVIMVSKDYVVFSNELIEFMQKIRKTYCQYDYLNDGYKVRDALDSNGDTFDYQNVHNEFTNNLEYIMHMDDDKPLSVTFGITKDNNLTFGVQVVELCAAQPFQIVYDRETMTHKAKTPYLKNAYPASIEGYYLAEFVDGTNVFICTRVDSKDLINNMYFRF